ncbi:ubiquinol-cytochrome c reductase iron-sulfur subunit N-terminal domain-containing protein [Defluviimonas sp. D31]|uniref:ubiquinol-cytochrome c reductase iron-sulfur subunit N-terminal domain-containing protein n=1 Tax=Defluviimonas sp. D31 TaxID=3083253 RepID=UPI00296F5804|nr:ubiquinol-cytochrome c reductase iron-sulfur subunit N-terminal domain-containing protein [Defluviimonas sp. D31]MDW4548661.1 ubiquinol-cytochrome c reductase iron-sulfur subunit N-terminal domain-containing protein [Defluviimonas sp. D31]
MSKTRDADRPTRRDFLKLASTAAPAAAAAAALGPDEAAAEEQPKTKGLQDTIHTRAYYASARF